MMKFPKGSFSGRKSLRKFGNIALAHMQVLVFEPRLLSKTKDSSEKTSEILISSQCFRTSTSRLMKRKLLPI